MNDIVTAVVTLLVLAFILVYCSGEFSRRNQTPRVVVIVAIALPLAMLGLLALASIF